MPPALQPLESYPEKSRELLDDKDDKSLSRKSTETAHDGSSSDDASVDYEEDEDEDEERRDRERNRPRQRMMTRSISEVRDGIQSLRDAELGDPLEKEPTQPNAEDPNLVTWAYPYDPENPKTWTFKKKWAAVLIGRFFCSDRLPLFTVTKSASSVVLYPLLARVVVDDCPGFG